MNSKERMRLAMKGEKPDRVPLMCQLALGHIYKNAGISPVDYWYDSKGFAEGFITMAERYRFDGILINISGVNPDLRKGVLSVSESGKGNVVLWKNGMKTFMPADDDPRPLERDLPAVTKNISEIDVDQVYALTSADELPPYYLDILDCVMDRKRNDLSIHGEVGTAFERFLLLLGNFEGGLMALLDNPDKCMEIMKKINRDIVMRALVQCDRGIDALKLSSPLAGAGFIPRSMYEQFVLPFESELVRSVKERYDIPCYMHTCGRIGDRLDLIADTGVDGIECLDPAPIGDVDLEKAVETIGTRVFIKGNLDSVNELMDHTPAEIMEIARKRLEIGMKTEKGYILSSACSVSPRVTPENMAVLCEAVEKYGKY